MITRLEFTRRVAQLLNFAESRRIPVIIDYVRRSHAEQDRLFQEGKSKTRKSSHVVGKAIDLYIVDSYCSEVILEDERYEELARFWKSNGDEFEWGGDFVKFRDVYHFGVKLR